MKTLGYRDLCDGNNTIKAFIKPENNLSWLFCQKKNDRIQEAFKKLKHLENCEIVYIKGNKIKHIAYRSI